ncbi:MAG: hypothetical protein MJ185_04320 [Treponema sp.]|nr:hypothetical protein [Treponema sp.]
MMKLKRAITNTFIAATLLLASCSPFNSNFVVYEEDTIAFEDYVAVKAILANYRAVKKDSQELHSSQSGARLIRPDLNASEYDFYIYGQKSYNDTKYILGPYNITSQLNSSGDSGEFELSVPRGTWYMTLIAVKQNQEFTAQDVPNVTTKALLTGCCIADFQNTDSHPNFVLSDAGLTTPGTINLKLSLDGWTLPDGITAKASLHYIKTGKLVENTEQDNLSKEGNTFTYTPQDGGTALKVNPGSYSFRLTLYDTNKTEWTWSDQIHIFPGREVDKELFIPQIINAVPDAPENFAFTIDINNPSDQSDYYNGTFTWDLPETGTTATEYELRLWDEGADELYKTYTTKNLNTILYMDGGLNASDTSITLWLPLGKKLSAQLRAKNRTGTSDEDWSLSTKVENINLYRVTYNLQGGMTKTNKFGEGTANKAQNFCFYGSLSSPHTWIVPDSSDIEDNENKGFDFWSASPEEGAPQLDTAGNEGKYAGYENVELYAHYKANLTHPLKNESGSLKLEYEYSNTKYSIPDNGEITIPIGKNLRLYITPTGFKYKSMTIKNWNGQINKFPYFDYNEWYYTELLTNGLSAGLYSITIEATFYNTETSKDEISKLVLNLSITE